MTVPVLLSDCEEPLPAEVIVLVSVDGLILNVHHLVTLRLSAPPDNNVT